MLIFLSLVCVCVHAILWNVLTVRTIPLDAICQSRFNCCKIDSIRKLETEPGKSLVTQPDSIACAEYGTYTENSMSILQCQTEWKIWIPNDIRLYEKIKLSIYTMCTLALLEDWDILRPLICLIWIYVHTRPINFRMPSQVKKDILIVCVCLCVCAWETMHIRIEQAQYIAWLEICVVFFLC